MGCGEDCSSWEEFARKMLGPPIVAPLLFGGEDPDSGTAGGFPDSSTSQAAAGARAARLQEEQRIATAKAAAKRRQEAKEFEEAERLRQAAEEDEDRALRQQPGALWTCSECGFDTSSAKE